MGSVALGVIFYGGHLPKLKTFQKSESSPTWTVVSREPSFYGNHVVVDFSSSAGGQWRGLLTVGLINNRVNPEGVSVSTFSHALEAMSVSTNPAAKNIFVLGLGAGIIPRNLKRKGIDVEVVELDPAVEAIAREYFSFNSEDIPVFIEDARTFVRKCPRKYDAIIVDLFSGDGIPSHVVTQEFFSDVRYCLSDNGALVMNSFYGNKDQRSKKGLFRTITSVFESVVVFEPPSKETSEIVQGYILANKNAKWSYNISLEDKPSFVI